MPKYMYGMCRYMPKPMENIAFDVSSLALFRCRFVRSFIAFDHVVVKCVLCIVHMYAVNVEVLFAPEVL